MSDFERRRQVGDLIIRGGTVVDGTRRDRYKADVRIRDAVIAEIGSDLSASPDDRIIDARGAFVTPGFIDSHTHFDPSLFWDPACDPMPQHGVTTVLSGNCSLSMAPLRQDHRGQLSRMFSYIED